ncbi:unnamed protein product [Cunninghamella blakesleeana]
MEDEISFIIIYDNTHDCKIKYVTNSVTDVVGWETGDLLNKTGYALFHEKDITAIRQIHLANVFQQKLSSMVSYRFLHKNGYFVRVETVVNYCYDIVVTTNSLYDERSLPHKQRMNSIDDAFFVTDNGELELISMGTRILTPEVLSRQLVKQQHHHGKVIWQKQMDLQENEPRFCLILNRYSEEMNVVFATHIATFLVNATIDNIIGKSIYDIVSERDQAMVESQLISAKSNNLVSRVRFEWVIDRDKDLYQPVDAVVTGTTDGLLMIVRLQPKPIQL